MESIIPGKIVRKIIFDILIQRSYAIDEACEEIMQKEVNQLGVYTEYTGELGTTACGTRVLADDILDGIIPLEEAVEVLTLEEREEAKARCQKWLNERNNDDIEK